MIDFCSMKRVALFSHVRPDGDTLGSMFGLRAALKGIGIGVDCYCDSPIPDELKFLDEEECCNKQTLSDYDACIAVDCADDKRLGNRIGLFYSIKNTYNIDHHGTNPGYAKTNIVRPEAATCEIIFDLLSEANIEISPLTAKCLYSGIVTDTGSFSQGNTTVHSHVVAAACLNVGVDVEFLHNRLMKVLKRNKLMFIADRIQNMRSLAEGRISVITVRETDLHKFGLDATDTEGLINYALNIEGVCIAASLTESLEHQYKVSLRCRKGYDVASVAGSFGGGGHIQAAGCQINNALLEEAVEKIVRRCEIELEERNGRHC